MAREPQAERQRREIAGVRQFDEGSSESELREVAVQRNPFDSAEDVRASASA